ncbi:Acyl-CoA synthetase short-chain family member 3, mitochondrial [Anas platyrhynchos]|uniref:acetate--CoA ligase n=1 Tax=Anas platyrhynchos TaxID=8839 RepID=R0KNW3_ANAPL|nr:Acyl-CoA synthetase short-chain family member 3, mitochondrial [Anas platyrhynchos]
MGGAGPRPESQEFLLTAGGGFKGAQGVGNHTEIVTGMRDWMKVTRPVDYQRLLLSGMYRKKDLPKRFVGGELNICYNAVDRHVENGRGDHVAIIYDSPVTNTKEKITYKELLEQLVIFCPGHLNSELFFLDLTVLISYMKGVTLQHVNISDTCSNVEFGAVLAEQSKAVLN